MSSFLSLSQAPLAFQPRTCLSHAQETFFLLELTLGHWGKDYGFCRWNAALHSVYMHYDVTLFGSCAAKYAADLGLDGFDIDLEGWGNDPTGSAFLKAATKEDFDHFAQLGDGKRHILTHAPEMPYFWHKKTLRGVYG